MRIAERIAEPRARAARPTTPDLSELPVVVRIQVQMMIDRPAERSSIRDRLATYVLAESQGAMPIETARTLNRILGDLGVAPVRVPEAAEVGTLEAMVQQHRSVDQVWNGVGYAPMSPAQREARELALEQVVGRIRNLCVPSPALTAQEQVDARNLLLHAIRELS